MRKGSPLNENRTVPKSCMTEIGPTNLALQKGDGGVGTGKNHTFLDAEEAHPACGRIVEACTVRDPAPTSAPLSDTRRL